MKMSDFRKIALKRPALSKQQLAACRSLLQAQFLPIDATPVCLCLSLVERRLQVNPDRVPAAQIDSARRPFPFSIAKIQPLIVFMRPFGCL